MPTLIFFSVMIWNQVFDKLQKKNTDSNNIHNSLQNKNNINDNNKKK